MHKWFKFMAVGMVALGLLLAAAALWMSRRASVPGAVAVGHSVAQDPAQHMLVAQRDLPAGHVLDRDDVRVQAVTQRPAGALEEPAAALGRGLAQALHAGAPVMAGGLLSGLAGMLQPGERAAAVKVDEASAVGHKLQPGDWVDVWSVLRRDGVEVGDTQARLLLERKRVLAYGMQLDAAAGPPMATERNLSGMPDPARQPTPPRTAVLAVQGEEAASLLLAERQGQVLLVLRNPLDAEKNASPAAMSATTLTSLGQAAVASRWEAPSTAALRPPAVVPVPRKTIPQVPPPKLSSVELVRGTRAEAVPY